MTVKSHPVCVSGSSLCKDLRLYLSKCFTPGSMDSQLQQLIRENLYLRAVPCKTHTHTHYIITHQVHTGVNLCDDIKVPPTSPHPQVRPGSLGMGRSQAWTTTLCPLRSFSLWRSLELCWRVASLKVQKNKCTHKKTL